MKKSFERATSGDDHGLSTTSAVSTNSFVEIGTMWFNLAIWSAPSCFVSVCTFMAGIISLPRTRCQLCQDIEDMNQDCRQPRATVSEEARKNNNAMHSFFQLL